MVAVPAIMTLVAITTIVMLMIIMISMMINMMVMMMTRRRRRIISVVKIRNFPVSASIPRTFCTPEEHLKFPAVQG